MGKFWNSIKRYSDKAWNATGSNKARKLWTGFENSANRWAKTPDGRATLMKMRMLTGGLSDEVIKEGGGIIHDVVNRPKGQRFDTFLAKEIAERTPLNENEVKAVFKESKPLVNSIDKGIGKLEDKLAKKKRGVRRK